MDAGATVCSSSRRKLFPETLIEEWHPNIKVEIASGLCLPVLAKGTMVFKTRPLGTLSTKKAVTISAPHSLLVVGMPVTLISPKALYNFCNIRTYYNDELCMVLPDGQIVGFYETKISYIIPFDGDTTAIQVTRKPNNAKWPWVIPVAHRTTLRDPLPLTWDLLHERCAHVSPERIFGSSEYVSGIDIPNLGAQSRNRKVCIGCIRGAFRGHRHQKRALGVYTRFCQRVSCDSCAMPKSTPFGYTEMYIFYDACTKYIAVYFGKSTKADEMTMAFLTFVSDHKRWMPKGHVEEWYVDGGPEFKSRDQQRICAEMQTRRRFIAPWNPWMNVAETGWRIILRPVRIILASCNVTRAFWPFAVQHVVLVHNALSTSSDTASVADSAAALLTRLAMAMSLSEHKPPPSPYFNVTGKPYDLSNLRVLFCEAECRIRNHDDLRKRMKTDPITSRALNLGHSPNSHACMVYLLDQERFTTASYNDMIFREDVRPHVARILGRFALNGREGSLPSEEQQLSDTGGVHVPELTLPHSEIEPETKEVCPTTGCRYPPGHGGPCSTVVDATLVPRRPGLTHRDQTRRRDTANIVAAVEGSGHILTTEHDVASFMVAVAGDGPGEIAVCYNTMAPETLSGAVEPPTSTPAALNGPNGSEWLVAYQRDLTAKIKNQTFTYARRPQFKKVIPTKVAHTHKHGDPNDVTIITEFRARWVGLGFRQGLNDFSATYCATPNAASLRLFAAIIICLGLHCAGADVVKAFTLNPIDVELYVEQMPGMEVAGDWPGATKRNTVCFLHKCLEGLKQAGNIWQTTHSGFLNGLDLPKSHGKLKQSTVEPCIFIAHCALGILAILVWVDDLWISYSCLPIYEEFVALYKLRFPSTHEQALEKFKFAGVSLHHRQGISMTVHQRPHIEMAFNKFVTDKVAASKSPAIHRPAVADRASQKHYSKITLAADDTERAAMHGKPFLSVLATLMYVTHFTNPHLNYYTSFLGQFMHDPSPHAYECVIDLLIYAYYNREIDVIVYGGDIRVPNAVPQHRRQEFRDCFGYHGWSDASWLLRTPAGFFLFFMNGPIDWAAKLIRVICLSTAEAEIAAGCMLGKRVVFITQLLQDFKLAPDKPPLLLIDNSATDDLCCKNGVTPRTAHFLRWQYYLR